MRIQIIEIGYNKFDGNLCGVDFKDGISVDELSQMQVNQISAAMRVKSLDNSPVGSGERYIADINKPMTQSVTLGRNKEVDEDKVEVDEEVGKLEYDIDRLSTIADEQGIAGLRVVGDKYDVKSNNISDLINKIINAQKSK